MQRKLIKQGGGGLVAYIPKKWLDSKNLKPGDELTFIQEAEELIISASKDVLKKEITLDIRKEDELFVKIIINDLYRTGYDRIILKIISSEQAKIIEQIANRYLLGMEVTEIDSNHAIIENITIPDEEKQELLLRRIFHIINEMFAIVFEELKSGNIEHPQLLLEFKEKVGKYDNFSRRNISKKRFYQKSSSFYWGLYNNLYLISHSLMHLHETLIKAKKPASRKIISIYTKIQTYYQIMHTGFFKKEENALKEINGEMNEFLYTVVLKEMEKGKEVLSLYYCAELIRILYKTNSPAIGILIGKK